MKPVTVVIVPGAWHPASCYNSFITELDRCGFNAEVVSLRTLNDAKATVVDDQQHIREEMILLLETKKNRDIVLLMHSYGSIPGLAAAVGLSQTERMAAGKKNGIIGLICIAAFVLREGISLSKSMAAIRKPEAAAASTSNGQAAAAYMNYDDPSPGLCTPLNPRKKFFNGIDVQTTDKELALLQPHASRVFTEEQPRSAWFADEYRHIRGYIETFDDASLPPVAQDFMLQQSGHGCLRRGMQCGHNAPFLAQAKETIEIVEGLLQAFELAKSM